MLRKLFFRWLLKYEVVYQLQVVTKIKGEEAFDVTSNIYFDYAAASLHMHKEVNDLIFERGARIIGKDNYGNLDLELDGKLIQYMITAKKIFEL